MRTHGSAQWLEAVRRLAVTRVVDDGHAPAEVAEFLGVSRRSVERWVAGYRAGGGAALAAVPHPGPAPKLTARQADRVLSWIRDRRPQDLGFGADTGSHWTARRVAAVVERRLGVRFNHRYLNAWLARRGITPQLPQRVPRERDQAAIDRWVAADWPRIKRGRRRPARPWSSRTRRAS
jgi:transposase